MVPLGRYDGASMRLHEAQRMVLPGIRRTPSNFAQFYFHHRHHSDWSEEWRSLFFPESRVYLRGEKGQVLFFPSHMMHGVTPHNSDKLRKTVAFNIKLQQ